MKNTQVLKVKRYPTWENEKELEKTVKHLYYSHSISETAYESAMEVLYSYDKSELYSRRKRMQRVVDILVQDYPALVLNRYTGVDCNLDG